MAKMDKFAGFPVFDHFTSIRARFRYSLENIYFCSMRPFYVIIDQNTGKKQPIAGVKKGAKLTNFTKVTKMPKMAKFVGFGV